MGRKKRLVYWMNATSAPNVSDSAMIRPLPYQIRRASATDERLHHRVEGGLPARGAEERAPIVGVEPPEPLALVPLAYEELHDRHALQRLLEEAVQTRQAPADLPVGVARVQPEVRRHDQEQRHQGEGHQRQAPVDPEHHDHDAGERDDVGHDGEETARERLADGLHVVEHARHEPSDRVAIEEARLQTQEVVEDRLAQIVDHALAGELHQVGFDGSQRVEDREHRDVEPADPRETDPV